MRRISSLLIALFISAAAHAAPAPAIPQAEMAGSVTAINALNVRATYDISITLGGMEIYSRKGVAGLVDGRGSMGWSTDVFSAPRPTGDKLVEVRITNLTVRTPFGLATYQASAPFTVRFTDPATLKTGCDMISVPSLPPLLGGLKMAR